MTINESEMNKEQISSIPDMEKKEDSKENESPIGQAESLSNTDTINKQETEKLLSNIVRTATSSQFEEDFKTITPGRSFEWPDAREKTEVYISQLKEKQILFILGCNSVWLNWAPTRLASVLQGSLNNLWTECDGVKEISSSEKGQSTSFGFWKKYSKQPKPIIICIPIDNADEYLRTLSQAGWDTASHIINELKEKNIYLLIPTKDKVLFLKLHDKDKSENFSDLSYSYWQIPSIQLELNKCKGATSVTILNAINTLLKKADLNDQTIYYIIHENSKLPDEDLLKLIEEKKRIDNREFVLLDNAMEDETELKIRILYAAAFFHETSIADFEIVLSFLLRNRTITRKMPDETYETQPLSSIWSNPIRQLKMMNDCLLTVREINNTNVISFSEVNNEEMKNAFLHKSFYPIFFFNNKRAIRK